ncbi:hypothetical protein A2U01_0096794, partial [Trifolium medium]|nr:hypothetical protein [Trifolium medium]
MARHGQSMSRGYHADHYSRSPTPVHREDSSALHPLTCDILRAPIPKGFERPPELPPYDGLTDPDDHISAINVTLDFR